MEKVTAAFYTTRYSKQRKQAILIPMKKKYLFVLVVLLAAVFGACKSKNTDVFPGEENFDRDASYALGMNLGSSLRESMLIDGIIPNYDEFINGLKDGLSASETRFSLEEAINLVENAFNTMQESVNSNLIQEENDFLAQNAVRPGVIITRSGLQYEILIESNGEKPSLFDTVQVHYEGRLSDGSLFDSTYEYGMPAEFSISEIFTGLSEGLQLMTVGSTYRFFIPSEIAFGSNNNGVIPPYSTLVFTIELLKIL